MKCRAFERSFSAWMDTRKSAPLGEDMQRHLVSCPGCASFVHAMERLEEMFGKEGMEPPPGIPDPAFSIGEIVLQETRDEGSLTSVRGFLFRLAGCSLPGMLMLLPGIGPGWISSLGTFLVFPGLAVLTLDYCFHNESRQKRMAGSPGGRGDDAGGNLRRLLPTLSSLTRRMLRAMGAS